MCRDNTVDDDLVIEAEVPSNLLMPRRGPIDAPTRPPSHHHLLIFRTASGSERPLPPSWPDKPRPTRSQPQPRPSLPLPPPRPSSPPSSSHLAHHLPYQYQHQTPHDDDDDNDDTETLYSHASAIDLDPSGDVRLSTASFRTASPATPLPAPRAMPTTTTSTTTKSTSQSSSSSSLSSFSPPPSSSTCKPRRPAVPVFVLAADALIKGALAYSADAHARFARRVSGRAWSRLLPDADLRVILALVRVAGAGLMHMPDEAHCNIPWLSAGVFGTTYSSSTASGNGKGKSKGKGGGGSGAVKRAYRGGVTGFVPKVIMPRDDDDAVRAVVFGEPAENEHEQKGEGQGQGKKEEKAADKQARMAAHWADAARAKTEQDKAAAHAQGKGKGKGDRKGKGHGRQRAPPHSAPVSLTSSLSAAPPSVAASAVPYSDDPYHYDAFHTPVHHHNHHNHYHHARPRTHTQSTNPFSFDQYNDEEDEESPPPSMPISLQLPIHHPASSPPSSCVPLSFAMTLSVATATLVRLGCVLRVRHSAPHHSASLRVRSRGSGRRRFSFVVSFEGSAPCTVSFKRPRFFGVVAPAAKPAFKGIVAEVETVLTDFVDRVCGRRVNGSRLVFTVR